MAGSRRSRSWAKSAQHSGQLPRTHFVMANEDGITAEINSFQSDEVKQLYWIALTMLMLIVR